MSFVDQGRRDPFANDGRARAIVISEFSPVYNCVREQIEGYMVTATASFEDNKFAAAYGLPNGTSKSLGLHTCASSSTKDDCTPSTLPIVLFTGALGTSRTLYNSMLQSVAAAGYLVVSVDHPYDADIVEFSNGTFVTGVDIPDDALENALTTRRKDVTFLYKQLKETSIRKKLFPMLEHSENLPRTAILGHSFGGAAAAATMQHHSFIRGALNIDGTLFGTILKTGLDRPFMLIGHANKTQETDPSWKTVWPKLKGWKMEIEVKGSAYYSFSDLPLIASVLGLQEKLPSEIEQVLGSIDGHRMMNLTISYVTAFLDMVLKSRSEEALVRANEAFPEVVVVD